MNAPKYARALLELLQLKNKGQAPTAFSETLVPVVVTNAHYGVDLLFTSNDNSTGALPRTVTGIVGAGAAAPGPVEILGISADISVGAAAGTRLLIQVGIGLPDAAAPIHWTGQLFVSGANLFATATYGVPSTHFPDGLIVPSGTRMIAQAVGDAGGADHVLRLRVLQRVLATG